MFLLQKKIFQLIYCTPDAKYCRTKQIVGVRHLQLAKSKRFPRLQQMPCPLPSLTPNQGQGIRVHNNFAFTPIFPECLNPTPRLKQKAPCTKHAGRHQKHQLQNQMLLYRHGSCLIGHYLNLKHAVRARQNRHLIAANRQLHRHPSNQANRNLFPIRITNDVGNGKGTAQ